MNNLISIIMPIYNSAKYLDEAIQSVIDQDYKNWELICVDDGSTDRSLEIAKSYQTEKIKIFSQSNSGPAQARKLGISKSVGEYISYLDSDDVYSDDYLSKTLKQAINSDADVVMPTLIQNWNSKKEYNFSNKHNLTAGDVIASRDAFLRTFPWSVHSLNLYKASHIKKYALSDISNVNNFNADEYLARYLMLFSNKVIVSEGTYYYRYNCSSITKKFSLRQFSSLKVDNLLYDLAINNGFNQHEISIVAKQLFINKVSLKYNYLSNLNIIKKNEREGISRLFDDKEIWYNHIRIDNVRMLKLYIFLITNNKLLLPVLKSRKLLKRYNKS